MEKEFIFIEEWKDVFGYCPPGYYQVSNLGNVKSLDRCIVCKDGKVKNLKGKNISPRKHGEYYGVGICGTIRYIHVLVAKAFPEICGEWFEGCQVDHLDTNKHNNVASNLRVCSEKDNHRNPLTRKHMSDTKKGSTPWNKGKKYTDEQCEHVSESLRGKYTYAKNPNAKPILQLTLDDEVIKEWDCVKSAAQTLGINQSNISLAANGHHKTAGGFKWKYITK